MTYGTTSATSSTHRLLFFDITANQNICDSSSVTNGSLQQPTWNLDFEFTPIVGNAYTFAISPSAVVISTYAINQFSLTIEEVPQITDGVYYRDSLSESGLTVQNLQNGNSFVGIKNTAASWRIVQNGGALEFQKETTPGSNIWVTKSTLI